MGNAIITKATEKGGGGGKNNKLAPVEGESRNRRLPEHEKTTVNGGTAKRIQFEESEETEDDEIKHLTEEERKTRRRRANLMAIVMRASTKSHNSVYLDEQEGERISMNSITKTFQTKTAVGQIFDSVKDECRFLGDYAFKHFYIDYELQREKKFTWESITKNLLNSQSKFHTVLTGKKGFT